MRDPIKYLEEKKIKFESYKHEAVFTVEEAEKIDKNIPGLHCKNLFVKKKPKNESEKLNPKYFLITMNALKRLQLKEVAKELGVKNLTFCNEDELWDKLKIKPGSVSPLCLINNDQKDVHFIISKEVYEADLVGFHPNDNTATLVIEKENFHRLIESFGNKYSVFEF